MSRRIRPKPAFALQQRVEQMWNRFDYPDIDPGPVPFELSGGGGAPTVVVAASDATDLSKSKADYVCLGVDDQSVIQIALDLLPGQVWLTEGTYVMAAGVTLQANSSLVGMGMGATVLAFDSPTGPVIAAGSDSRVSDLFILGAGTDVAIGGTDQDRFTVERVWCQSVTTFIDLSGDYWSILNCGDANPASGPTYFVRDQGTFTRCRVTNNVVRGDLDMGNGTDWVVANNNMEGAISADGGHSGVVVGNVWLDEASPGAATALIQIANFSELAISGNSIISGGPTGISLDTVIESAVVGNTVRDADVSVYAAGCTNVVINSNHVKWSISHNIHLDSSSGCSVIGNTVVAATSADNIRIEGDRNVIEDNKSIPSVGFSTANIGINVVSGNDNIVVGNDLGDPGDYGTDALNNASPTTQLTYPNDPTYGSNFTI